MNLTARLMILCAFAGGLLPPRVAAGESATTQTVILIRHGEKPEAGLGQLNCQGLNRALALGGVLKRRFGRPDAIFVPNPAIQKQDRGKLYDYVRPLATIEPAAIAFGLPVDASIGLLDVSALAHALDTRPLRSALVLVAWEHTEIVALGRLLMAQNDGDANDIPNWDRNDFDSVYIIRITRTGTQSSSRFERTAEGLNALPSTCPTVE